MTAVQPAKQRLRLAMRQRLAGIPPASVATQSTGSTPLTTDLAEILIVHPGSHVLERLKGFKPYQDARRVSVFLSMPGGEIQTGPIVRHAFDSGKEVFVPYLHKNTTQTEGVPVRVMDMVRLHSLHDFESLKNDRWGIPSVDPSTIHERQRILGGSDANGSATATLDLVLMPGVAFEIDSEKEIRRLGHGKGFYDFFVDRYRQKLAALGKGEPFALLCALSLNEQLISVSAGGHVPVGPLDQRLDALVLGSGEIIQAARKGS